MSADLQMRPSAPPVARPQAEPPALALVPGRAPALGRASFLVLLVALMAAGLLGLLALNTALARDAFRAHALTQQAQQLQDRQQALQREVEDLRSPQRIAEQARAMGMVVSGPPAFLRLPDGKVLGAPEAAVAASPAPGEAVAPGNPARTAPASTTAPTPGPAPAPATGAAR